MQRIGFMIGISVPALVAVVRDVKLHTSQPCHSYPVLAVPCNCRSLKNHTCRSKILRATHLRMAGLDDLSPLLDWLNSPDDQCHDVLASPVCTSQPLWQPCEPDAATTADDDACLAFLMDGSQGGDSPCPVPTGSFAPAQELQPVATWSHTDNCALNQAWSIDLESSSLTGLQLASGTPSPACAPVDWVVPGPSAAVQPAAAQPAAAATAAGTFSNLLPMDGSSLLPYQGPSWGTNTWSAPAAGAGVGVVPQDGIPPQMAWAAGNSQDQQPMNAAYPEVAAGPFCWLSREGSSSGGNTTTGSCTPGGAITSSTVPALAGATAQDVLAAAGPVGRLTTQGSFSSCSSAAAAAAGAGLGPPAAVITAAGGTSAAGSAAAMQHFSLPPLAPPASNMYSPGATAAAAAAAFYRYPDAFSYGSGPAAPIRSVRKSSVKGRLSAGPQKPGVKKAQGKPPVAPKPTYVTEDQLHLHEKAEAESQVTGACYVHCWVGL